MTESLIEQVEQALNKVAGLCEYGDEMSWVDTLAVLNRLHELLILAQMDLDHYSEMLGDE